MIKRLLPAAAAGVALLATVASPAFASPPRPADLRVVGGTEVWHPENRFSLSWTTPVPGNPALTTTRYRIRDPQGTTIGESHLGWIGDGIGPLIVPATPGAYSAEVWFEDAGGEQGPAATVPMRFDDVRPAASQPQPVAGWIGRTAFPLRVRLGHPSGPPPLSGIRGYAIAIDATPGGGACAAPDRCSDAETTLRGGIAGDELEIGTLPEGTSYLHAVAVSGSGMKSTTGGWTVLRADTTDPVTRLAGLPPGWTNRTVRLTASATDTGSGMERDGQGPAPFTAIQVDGGAPSIGPGGTASASVVDEGVHRITYYARDLAGNVNDGAETNGIADRAPGTAFARIDRTPPSVAFANAEDPHDPELLRVRIADRLSGPDLSRGWIGVRPAGSGDRFEALPAMPGGAGELRARWDSDAFPAGGYEFQALGYDAAGNTAATVRRLNGGPMVLSNPLKATTTLRAGFRRHGLQRTVPYGRRVLLGGRLIAGRSSPLGGTPVRVVERFAPGAHPAVQTSTVMTAPNGTLSIRTGPGPSRTIVVSFDGSPTLARSTTRMLQLGVRSRVRLRASAGVATVGGAPLIFRGRLVAAPSEIAAGGKSIELQFRLPGLPWAEFRTVQTDGRGRFRYAYRFSDDDSRGIRFQFRAYAPAQDDWPYEPAGSRPILVKGI
ncbi:MAG TPA: hypothetical protein VK471_04275 [Solirubrobacterales bacterium]|nr:hypothetical protein [Solirubrobacterales bacterium]